MTPTLRPTIKQHEVWQALQDDEVKYVYFGGGAGSGKSWLICEWLIVLSYQYPGMKAFIGRRELKRLMSSTYLTFFKVLDHHGIPKSHWKHNGQYNYLENLITGSRIDLLDLADKPSDPLFEDLGSTEYTVGAIEEAGEVPFMAFDVLKSRVGRHLNKELKSKILITGNPKKNWTYSVFYKPAQDGTLDKDKRFIQALYTDNPHTAKEYGENLASLSNQALKERLMFGNWEYDDDPTALIDQDALNDLFHNKLNQEDPKPYLTVDVARFGQDHTVLTRWRGLEVVEIKRYQKTGMDKVVRLVEEMEEKHQIPRSHIVVDEDGIGGGPKDFLPGIKGFVANTAPKKKENYQNLKAQCSYKLAEMINQRKIAVSITDEKLKELLLEELGQIKSKDSDKDNKLQIQPKEKVKEMLGRSPDLSDTLMMRMMLEFVPKVGITVI